MDTHSPQNPDTETLSPEDVERGRDASKPGDIPLKGWKDVALRVYHRLLQERVTLTAAGVAFYLLLSLFPGLAALVSLYGLISDPSTIGAQMAFLSDLFPADALDLVLGQLKALSQQNDSTLSIGFFVGLGISLWSARNGVAALFEAMNLAYAEEEKRGFLSITLFSILFTLGGLLVTAVLTTALAVLPVIMAVVFIPDRVELLMKAVRWPIMLAVIWLGTVLIYRFGPSREDAKLRWLNFGTVFSTAAWLVTSLGFSYYIENFADLNATYGTLGTFIGFMLWTWISVVILIVGAIINAELEHQTVRDSTTGPSMPMGERGATMADTLGETQG
ncbi:YihY/virulence factor BrkB family protein [Rhizobium glycinendophyticum]|uniref:YihY/virulence factor BrkB family protein n=1 Tax=Rhizobium glycinendophyticum TaxID=2589807 RepID=A0A504U3G4_9HYPH|nr:YihY/virulence factor BrkB family protein [Rhizobium glycinendophyticum]TPP09478.1 YihY/virulence factor BrkB family protein [Rhizobium glycinendophyticum]